MNGIDWENFDTPGASATELTGVLHSHINRLVGRHFPIVSRSVKSTDKPWITDKFRRLDRRKRKEYYRNGRSLRYGCLKADALEELNRGKKEYYRKECGRLTTPGSHKVPFNALKNLGQPWKNENWKITDLYPGETEIVAMERLGVFFNKISSEFDNLSDSDLITKYDKDLITITEAMVVEMVSKMKKTKSMVPGDVPPHFLL